MLARLDHVSLAVRDLDAATRATARLLGRSPSWRGEQPAAGAANAIFRVENAALELVAAQGEGAVGDALRAAIAARGEGLVGLAFGTDDAEACREAWRARGLEPGPVEKGMGRDVESGAFREWRRVALPPARTRGMALAAIEARSPAELLPISPPLGDADAAVSALDHAVVRTRDAEAARALFGEALGLRMALDREFPHWGARLIFFRVGGVTVEVAAALAPEPGPDEGDRLWGLSWRVGDAEAARARLAASGFDVSPVRAGHRPGTRVASVRDGTLGVPTLLISGDGA